MSARTLARATLAALFVLGLALSAQPTRAEDDPVAVPPQQVLAEMKWLAGSWTGSMWGGTFHAYYSTPEGGKILSFSHLEKDGKRVFHEFEVFSCAETLVHYQPYPGGKRAGGFTFKGGDSKQRKAIFENPKKDYPTRVVFQREAADRLVITLSDPHGGSKKTETFALRRAE